MGSTPTSLHTSNKSITIDVQRYHASTQLHATLIDSMDWRSAGSTSQLMG